MSFCLIFRNYSIWVVNVCSVGENWILGDKNSAQIEIEGLGSAHWGYFGLR